MFHLPLAQSSYGKPCGPPSSIFGTASSPSGSASSSPSNFTLPDNMPAMAGWPPGAFHRFRWCYVNDGNFCKADATQVVPAGTPKCCAWCQLAMP